MSRRPVHNWSMLICIEKALEYTRLHKISIKDLIDAIEEQPNAIPHELLA